MSYNSQGGHLGIRTQSTKGTYADPGAAAPNNGIFMKLESGAMGSDRTLIKPNAEIGGARNQVQAELGPVSYSGSYKFYARLDSLATWIAAVLGSVTDAGTTPAFTHTAGTALALPWVSLEEQLGNGYEVATYADCKVDSLDVSVAANGYAEVDATVQAITGTLGATPTPVNNQVWDSSPLLVGTNVTVTLGGVSLPAKDIKLEWKNNLDVTNFLLGSFNLNSIDEKQANLMATFTVRPNDNHLLRQAIMGASGATTPQGQVTTSAMVVTLTSYEVIGASSTHYSLAVTIPHVILDPFKVSVQGDNPIENSITAEAIQPDPNTDICTAVVTNSKAATL